MTASADTASAAPGGALLAWKQLLRLGNVFTAASNVIAGFLIVRGAWTPGVLLEMLAAASMLLYAAGMVLNDAFDAKLDQRERPERPIPSGRIRRSTALMVGWCLLGAGLAVSLFATALSSQPAPLVVACCLAMTIVLYDAGLKATPAGPWAMGWCRTLNVLLGASAAERLGDHGAVWAYAAGVGLYTVALTYIARREVQDAPEQQLRVRITVKRMILGFIVLDAAAATLAAGWLSGIAVLALLIPSLLGARRTADDLTTATPAMNIGYNTNGLAHHALPAAIELLAELGYRSVAITLDHGCLNPFDDRYVRDLHETGVLLARNEMRSVIETGARFLLDPRRKHEPTLVSNPNRGQPLRIEFLCRAIDAAAALGSDCVSLWSGVVHDGSTRGIAMERLTSGLAAVLNYADHVGVDLAFEPEPDMLIDTMSEFAELVERVDSPRLGLTLDVGHLHCQGEEPIDAIIRTWRGRIVNVHIEDMRRGVHEHLMFGEGDMDFPPIIAALAEIGYDGGVHVELSRHSHDAPAAAQRAYEFLNPLLRVASI